MPLNSGNILFIILIAVVLLAALSYTVAQGWRAGSANLDNDKARIYAAEIVQYGNVLEHATSQLRLRGYLETEISFENSIVNGYANPNCTQDGCKVFNINGGAISFVAADRLWLEQDDAQATNVVANFSDVGNLFGNWYFPYNTCVNFVGTGGDDCFSDTRDVSELMVWLPWIKKEVCIAINDLLGIPNPSGVPPSVTDTIINSSAFKYNGTFVAGSGHEYVDMNGINTACIYHSTPGVSPGLGYFYYKVLIPR